MAPASLSAPSTGDAVGPAAEWHHTSCNLHPHGGETDTTPDAMEKQYELHPSPRLKHFPGHAPMVNSAVLGLLQVRQKNAFRKQNQRRQKCRYHYFNSSCFLLNCQISTQNSFNVHHAARTSLPSSQGTFCPQRTGVNTTETQAEGSSGRGPPSATGIQGQYQQAPA